jgi:8-oxo-dGTP pyrophosphatase MutT (NUDIX family)
MKIASRAIILHNHKILLVKHKGRDFYSLPGGKVDPDEDIQTAMKRELKEELDRDAVIDRLLFVHEFRYPEGSLSLEFFFRIQNGDDFLGELNGAFAEEELAEIVWMPVDTATNIMPPFLKEKIKNVSHQNEIEYHTSA